MNVKFHSDLEYHAWKVQSASMTVSAAAMSGDRNLLAICIDELKDAQKDLAAAARMVCRNA